jgi:hypothetical protein
MMSIATFSLDDLIVMNASAWREQLKKKSVRATIYDSVEPDVRRSKQFAELHEWVIKVDDEILQSTEGYAIHIFTSNKDMHVEKF